MSTATISVRHTQREILKQEEAVFSHIPGINKLRQAPPETIPELEAKYPDAAFALMIAGIDDFKSNNLFEVFLRYLAGAK